MVTLLVACTSGQYLHDEGLALLDEGKTREGLTKLQEAVKADPENASFRASLARNREQAVNRLLVAGNNERIAGHPDVAQMAYMRVLELDLTNARAKEGIAALEMDKRHAKIIVEARELIKKNDFGAATDALRPVLLENPENGEALALQRRINELIEKEKSAGPSLTAKFRRPVTMEFRDANVKMVFEALSRTSGINVLLDKDVRPDLKTSIFVKDASVEDTIDLIRLQNQLEKKVLNENTVFIYPNTPDKNKEYQDLKVRSFHLTNADPKQMVAMLKALLKTKDTFVNEQTNSIIMRDTPAAIRLAEKMIADQDIPEPEVMLEVEVLEVNRNRLTQLGVNWPNQLSLTATGSAGGTGTATGMTLEELRHINGNKILTAPALGVTLNLLLQDTDTNILASPRIRARNREKAKIMIGDRVPVITNAVTPVSTGTPVVTGSVQYLDVGLKLEVEPDIHLDNEVAIRINMEVSSIAKEVPNAVSGTLAYQIGTRNASTLLQLKDGETQILAGLISNEDRAAASKVPGLGQLPILGRLFASHKDDHTKSEIVLSITPHIVGRSRIPDARETEYWSGTEANLRDDQLLLKPIAPGPAVAPAAAPAAASPQLPAPTATPVSTGPSPMVLSWQGPSQVNVGDKISLTLNLQSAQGMNNLGLMVNFDPAVLKVVDVVEGNILKQNNMQSNFTKAINQNIGQIGVSMSGHSTRGAIGDGSVVTLTFEVTSAAPQSQITLSRLAPTRAGGRELAYSAPEPYLIAVGK
jgi:general secretion pathway protein D